MTEISGRAINSLVLVKSGNVVVVCYCEASEFHQPSTQS